MMLNKKSERLYLSKGDEDIYVDISELPQHQIDGIRFLYKQFKKKTHGVIINDPRGYGKTLQVVLFLNAIHSLLDKPVLIICDEHDAQNWMEHFQKWTQLSDRVKIQLSNPYRKDMTVCINKMVNLASFSIRDWSIVVIDDETASRAVLKVGFKADFKIWITSMDMKTNLQTFSHIYNWLYPKEMISPLDLVANKSFKDIIEKAIFLDSLMEDVVLRRYDFIPPFKLKEEESKVIQTEPKAKNKDASGTKIKRSKRKSDDNSSIIEDVKKEQTNTDIESFIREQKPMTSDTLEEFQCMQVLNKSQSSVGKNINAIDYSVESAETIDSNIKRKKISNVETELIEVNEDSNDNKTSECNEPKELYVSSQSQLMDELVYEESDQKFMESDSLDFIGSKNEIDFNVSNIQRIKSQKFKLGNNIRESNADSSNSSVLVDTIVNVDSNPSSSKKTTDELMSEMEDKMLKKFKGSFLDIIF